MSKNTSTDDGLCLVTANREQVETNATSSLCRKIIKLPALPLEISQETPSYLKILSNRKVMLGRYPDSVVVVSDIIETIEFRCDFEEAETPQTYFDCIKSRSSTPQKYEANLQVIDYKDALKYVKSGFSIAAWDVFAESPIGRLPIEGLIDQAKWQEHYDSSKRILEQNGFEVVTIEQPYPFLEIKKLSFRSPSGILLKTEINTELHFFSFANSLILGSTAFVPTFQYDDFKFANHHELQLKLQTLNNKAIQLYEDEGFHTEAIVADKNE